MAHPRPSIDSLTPRASRFRHMEVKISLNPKKMENMPFCLKGLPYIQNFTADNIEVGEGNSKHEKNSNYLIFKESYVSIRFYTCLINSFTFIHCFLPK